MLTRGEAASTYDRIIKILTHSDGFYFHTTDGEDLSISGLSYDSFIDKINKIEFIDTENTNYNKLYINPFLKVLLIVSGKKNENGNVDFSSVSFELIEFIYEQFRLSVNHGYRIALDDMRRNVTNLFKTDRNLDDIDINEEEINND